MAPFGNDVWFLLGITYLLVSVCIVVIHKIPCSQYFGIMMMIFFQIGVFLLPWPNISISMGESM